MLTISTFLQATECLRTDPAAHRTVHYGTVHYDERGKFLTSLVRVKRLQTTRTPYTFIFCQGGDFVFYAHSLEDLHARTLSFMRKSVEISFRASAEDRQWFSTHTMTGKEKPLVSSVVTGKAFNSEKHSTLYEMRLKKSHFQPPRGYCVLIQS
jgi:hypothetical protein